MGRTDRAASERDLAYHAVKDILLEQFSGAFTVDTIVRLVAAVRGADAGHEALREAARVLVEADCVLHASAPAETWERYTRAIVRLRAVLDA